MVCFLAPILSITLFPRMASNSLTDACYPETLTLSKSAPDGLCLRSKSVRIGYVTCTRRVSTSFRFDWRRNHSASVSDEVCMRV
jgi:hypothetical protein